jgi:hypothetical protein
VELFALISLLLMSLSFSTALAADEPEPTIADIGKQFSQIIGKPGELKDGVYTITIPRDDLTVRIEGMDVPPACVASTFHVYLCSCGKTNVIGEFIVPDYEANDVAFALQKENILVSSMAPFLIYEKPKMMSVRFQAEGKPEPIAKAIRAALDWTGKDRMRGATTQP